MVEFFRRHQGRNCHLPVRLPVRLLASIDATSILTYASSPASEPRPFGGRREALLEEANEGERGARHATDFDALFFVVVGRGAARAAEAVAIRRSDLRGTEAPTAVAGAEQLRDRIAGMARSGL